MSDAGPGGQLQGDAGETFRLEGELGRGGMGVVYRAFDPRIGRPVALKVGLASQAAGRLERFRREGEIAASLHHPGIVRVHSSGSIQGRPYLCFELVESAASLEQELTRAPLGERLRLIRELAEALGYAHAAGVVHRDVKPENVLVDSDGRARLTDFGVARALDQERLTGTGTVLGTPLYAAPEQLRDGHRVGPPADVWSLGVILYEALTGALPFQGETLMILAARIASGTLDPPRALDAGISPELEAVCLRALRLEPEQRYPDAAEFAADLARAERGERTLAAPRRQRRGWLLGALAGLTALALGAWALAPGSSIEDAAPSASLPQAQVSGGWRELAEPALARGEARRALELLAQAPPADEAADLLRARARIALGQGQRALEPLRRLPPGTERAVLALQAQVEGAPVEDVNPLLAEGSLDERDPLLLRWRLLEALARPAPLAEIEQAYRRARRGNPALEALEPALQLQRHLARFSWAPDAMWTFGEDSQHDPRLGEALEFMARVRDASLEDSDARRALYRGVQRWCVRRLRYALARLFEVEWRTLALRSAGLLPSPEADEARLLALAGTSNTEDAIVLPPLREEEARWLELGPERGAALPRPARRLLLAGRLARGSGASASLARRRDLTHEVLALLPPGDEILTFEESQGMEVAKEACLAEALRCTEEAWLADTPAERARALTAGRERLRAITERCSPKWIRNDWRYAVAHARLAALSGETAFFRNREIATWSDTRREVLRLCFVLEVHLLGGDLPSARLVGRSIRELKDFRGWEAWLENQLLFLSSPPGEPQATTPQSNHPFPWRSEEATRRLLRAGWRPGQPLYPALAGD